MSGGRNGSVPAPAVIREIHRKERRRRGQIAAVDPATGDYAVGRDVLSAVGRARRKHPRAVFYLVRIGYRTVGSHCGGPRRVG